jgi:hypothetical protein
MSGFKESYTTKYSELRRSWTGNTYQQGKAPSSVTSYESTFTDGRLDESYGNNLSNLGKAPFVGDDFKVTKRVYGGSGIESPRMFGATEGDIEAMDGKGKTSTIQVAAKFPATGAFPPLSYYSGSYLDAKGTTAIARVLPTNPVAGLSQAIGETREGLPSLGLATFKERTNIARNAGGDYLNQQFGWVPLVNDIRKFAYAIKHHEEIVRQYEKDSGKKIPRRYAFPIEYSNTETKTTGQRPKPGLDDLSFYTTGKTSGTLTKVRKTEDRVWFEGCFTYYLPPANTMAGMEARANKIIGQRLTPETLWNLAPWTWMADWAGNLGDVFHNVSAFAADKLVMPYGYVMGYRSIIETYNIDVSYKTYGDMTLSQTFTTIVKQRRRATPYGFGFNMDGISLRQGAILGALGLSRGRKY